MFSMFKFKSLSSLQLFKTVTDLYEDSGAGFTVYLDICITPKLQ